MMFPQVRTSEVLDVPWMSLLMFGPQVKYDVPSCSNIRSPGCPPSCLVLMFSHIWLDLSFPCFGVDLKIVYSKFRPFMYNLNSENTSILNSENLEIGKCIKVWRGQGQLGFWSFWAFGVIGSQNSGLKIREKLSFPKIDKS